MEFFSKNRFQPLFDTVIYEDLESLSNRLYRNDHRISEMHILYDYQNLISILLAGGAQYKIVIKILHLLINSLERLILNDEIQPSVIVFFIDTCILSKVLDCEKSIKRVVEIYTKLYSAIDKLQDDYTDVPINTLKTIQYLLGNTTVSYEEIYTKTKEDELTYLFYIHVLEKKIKDNEQIILETVKKEFKIIEEQLVLNSNYRNEQERLKPLFNMVRVVNNIFFLSFIENINVNRANLFRIFKDLKWKR